MVHTGRSNKQSKLIIGYVTGVGKSVPSMGGAEKQEIQLGDALLLKEIECSSSGKRLALELARLGVSHLTLPLTSYRT